MSAVVVVRQRLVIHGVVQGVGFRPHVYRLAVSLDLSGFVGNDSASVFVEVEGPAAAVEEFAARLAAEAPPLAVIESVVAVPAAPTGAHGFEIVASAAVAGARTLVPPDVATCADCLGEVLDPGDRRYRYPFTNCTNCGPRFTIIRGLPYDRSATTMADFTLCRACAREYGDPLDRRYHAQPVACPACGPQVAFERAGCATVHGTDAVIAALHDALAAGEVVAVKGLGGYHLAVDAADDDAIARLRARKGRVDKPFAVMVPDLDAARALAVIDEREAALLASPARPIVLVRRRIDDQLATAAVSVSALVAPGNPLVGVMLPYTPLHHLIFRPVPGRPSAVPRAIVLTSGNLTDEPIRIDDDDAHTRLAALADAFLTHDRPIHVPCDDSVVRVVDGVEQPVRRSRGYAPLPVTLPVEVAPVLAVGGELKNTFCVASGRHAWMSQHIGDMENLETLAAFARSTEQFSAMYAIAPAVLAADRHPGYLTRRWAHDHAEGRPVVEVQHHHAHVAALMAEHGLDGSAPIVGVAFDGTGYGTGYGTQASGAASIWGGEVLVADYDGFERVAHLAELPLPGGDAAVRNPCRIALAYLVACGIDPSPDLPAVAACDETERRVVPQQVARGAGIVPTSSMGRLFDAVASLLGVRHRISYEAQAAIELEVRAAACPADRTAPLAFALAADGTIDAAPLLRELVDGVRAGVEVAALARGFHDAVVAVVVELARRERARRGIGVVGLTGGVFQNALLTSLTRTALEAEGFDVLIHRLVPANDGGLALGQAIVAGRRKD